MTNTKLTTHPFAQIATAEIEQVSGGFALGDIKQVTMKQPEDGISKLADEGGTGPIFTTLAIGEEGGNVPEQF